VCGLSKRKIRTRLFARASAKMNLRALLRSAFRDPSKDKPNLWDLELSPKKKDDR
jgi:hypothetical protein